MVILVTSVYDVHWRSFIYLYILFYVLSYYQWSSARAAILTRLLLRPEFFRFVVEPCFVFNLYDRSDRFANMFITRLLSLFSVHVFTSGSFDPNTTFYLFIAPLPSRSVMRPSPLTVIMCLSCRLISWRMSFNLAIVAPYRTFANNLTSPTDRRSSSNRSVQQHHALAPSLEQSKPICEYPLSVIRLRFC